MNKLDFDVVAAWVKTHGVNQYPSEVHGLIAGWICAGSKWDAADRNANLSGWLGIDLDDEAALMLDGLYKAAEIGLRDDALSFRLLLPPDEIEVNERAAAVSFWCSGFLAGFGMTGRYQEGELSADIKEVMTDLSRIASFADAVPEDDENEADLIEISEYVRMSAVLVFTECAGTAVH